MSIRERKGKKGITYQVYFPYKNELGISCIYRKGGFNTKKEAKAHETLLKAQIAKNGYLTQECELTLNHVFKDYFETKRCLKQQYSFMITSIRTTLNRS